MGTIMQYSAGAVNSVATLAFVVTVLAGVYLAAKFGSRTLWPAVGALVGSMLLRFGHPLPALSLAGIASMTVLHIAAGILIGLWLRRSKRFGPSSS